MSSQYNLYNQNQMRDHNDSIQEEQFEGTDSTNSGDRGLPRASLKQKIEVLDYLSNGDSPRNKADALRYFKKQNRFAISQATLSNWAFKEAELRKSFTESPHLSEYKRKPVMKYPEVTKAIETFIDTATSQNITITDSMIKQKFFESLKQYGYDYKNIKLSGGMLSALKKRNSLINGKVQKIDHNKNQLNSLSSTTTNTSSSSSSSSYPSSKQSNNSRVSISLSSNNNNHPPSLSTSTTTSPIDSDFTPMANGTQHLLQAQKLGKLQRMNSMAANSPLNTNNTYQNNNHNGTNTNPTDEQNQLPSPNYPLLPAQDFNFDDIFNNPSIGFNTRLIHSDDQFSNMFMTPEGSYTSNQITPLLSQNNGNSPLSYTNGSVLQNPLLTNDGLNNNQSSSSTLPYYPKFQDPMVISSSNNNNNNNTISSSNAVNENNKRPYVLENFTYSRTTHPNSEKVEKILQTITNGYVTIYNSGTSAIMGIMSYLNPKKICINNSGYQGTHQVLKLLNKLTGLQKLSLEEINNLNKGDVVLIETPMNPEGYCLDISYYAKLAHKQGAFLIVDSTLAPPPLQFPFQFDADYILYSASKYFSGHSDLLAGFLVTKTKREKNELHQERLSLGTNIANFDSFLLLRSLRTFKMRILQQCQNTEKIINFLKLQLQSKRYSNIIKKIHHSSLQSNEFVFRQLNNYYNPVFAIEFNNIQIAETILTRFNFLSTNNNLEGGETIVELTSKNPNFMTNKDIGIANDSSSLLRFSIGCEDYEDIVRDLDQALKSFE